MASQAELVLLVGRTALGDRVAFKELYSETSPQVFGLLNGMLRRPEIAQEVLQETYLKVWMRASDYHQERGQVLTWIAGIARYRALDLLRTKKFTQPVDEIDDDFGDPESSVEEIALSGERSRLGNCLQELTNDQRQSIALAYYRGLTHEEIAQQQRQPLGTIKSWVRRGLQSLKECMQR